jgi:hypothetical protein
MSFMTRSILLVLVAVLSSSLLLGCPDDKASPDNSKAAAATATSTAPAAPAASAKPAAKGGW